MIFAPLVILAILLFIAIGGAIVMGLWNWLLPALFDGPRITFWQAVGILALCRILFGGFGRHGCHRSRMTPEERERFRQGMRRRLGFGLSTSDGKEQ